MQINADTLNVHVRPFVTTYILACLHDYLQFQCRSDTRTLICPPELTADFWNEQKQDMIRYASGENMGRYIEWNEFRDMTNLVLTADIQAIMTPITDQLVAYVHEMNNTYGIGSTTANDLSEYSSIQDIWYEYCYVKLHQTLLATDITRLRNVIEHFVIPQDQSHLQMGYVEVFNVPVGVEEDTNNTGDENVEDTISEETGFE